MASTRNLFVAGMARSGTTALAELMTSHPRIAVGMERYKAMYRGHSEDVTASMFERERFFDFADELTNIRPDAHWKWRDYYAALDAKWDDVLYVGDKVTRLNMRKLWIPLPEARFVCILRGVHDVAASWEARAANPEDLVWDSSGDAQAAVSAWNTGLRKAAVAHRERPDLVALVEYHRLFGDPDAVSARAVLAWLGLAWTEEFARAHERAHRHYVDQVAPKQRTLADDDRAYVDEHAHLDRWERMLTRLM